MEKKNKWIQIKRKKNMNDGNCGKCVNSFESIEKVSHTIQ